MNDPQYNNDLLLSRLRSGDEKALREIYDRYWKKLFFIALKKVDNRDVAEEIVQNILVALWLNRATANIHHLETYLSSAVKYQVLNYYKKCMVQEKHTAHLAKQARNIQQPLNTLFTNDLLAAINKAINTLPEKNKKVFLLSRNQELSNKKISALLNISEKAVEYHITQALKTIRLHLKNLTNFFFLLWCGILVFIFF